jgi:adenylate cyclase
VADFQEGAKAHEFSGSMRSALVRLGLMFESAETEQAFVERYVLANRLATQGLLLVCGVIFYVFFIWDRIIDPVHWTTAHMIRGMVITPFLWLCAASLGLASIRRHTELLLTACGASAGIGLAVVYHVLDHGYDYGSVGFVLVVLVTLALFNMRMPYVALSLAIIAAAAAVGEVLSVTRPGMAVVNALCIAAAVGVGLISTTRREITARAEMRLAAEVEAAHQRIEDLLHSMLPGEIVDRIQAGETAIADAYGEVSIVFADLVGFTELSRRISPGQLVELLNRFFSEFDLRAERHGLERIKTIGDAYMAVGGLNRSASLADHARSAAAFALEAQAVVAELGRELGYPLNARVGLHIGPVVAGVIGAKRPAFDCWGEAVNLASRLEGVARPGSIIISESAYWRLKPHFPISVLDDVDLKGIGPTKIFLLEGPALDAARPVLTS